MDWTDEVRRDAATWRARLKDAGYAYGDVVTIALAEDSPALRELVRTEQSFQAQAVLAELGQQPVEPEFVEPWVADGKVWLAWGYRLEGEMRDHPAEESFRRFVLRRLEDVSGVSGTGVVAEGVEFSDGTVAVRWRGKYGTGVFHDQGMASVRAIHGHGGKTVIEYLD